MLPAPEASGAAPRGETVPWTTSVFLLLSELVMVVAKATSLMCSEQGQDQISRASFSSSQPALQPSPFSLSLFPCPSWARSPAEGFGF